MLVKFLSYVVSVFGTKRYKPVLLVCAVLAVSLVGLTAATAHLTGTPDTTTASAIKDADGTDASEPLSKQGLKQQPTASNDKIVEPAVPAEPSPVTPGSTATTPPTAPAPTEITVINSLVLKTDGEPAVVTASTTDNTTVQWTVTTDSPADIQIVQNPGAEKQFAASHSFTVKATHAARTDTSYRVKIAAKDTTRGIELAAKTIIVTLTKDS